MLSEIDHSLTQKYVQDITQHCKKRIEEVNNNKFELNKNTAKYFNTIGKVEHYYDQYTLIYLQCKNSNDPSDYKNLKKVRKIIYNEFCKIAEK